MKVSRRFLGVICLVLVLIFIGGVLIGISLSKKDMQPEKIPAARLEKVEDHTVNARFVAVDNNGKGVLGHVSTEIRPGTGLVLVNINNILADFNTQYSARLAALVAKNYTGVSLDNVDIIFNLEADASVIGGQSAGSIMTASAIAGLLNKTLRDDVLITGAINADGTIGEAGAIKEKAAAAKEGHARYFLVAPGFSSESSSLVKEKTCSTRDDYEFCRIIYKEGKKNIGDDLGITMVEVSTIGEALEYLLA